MRSSFYLAVSRMTFLSACSYVVARYCTPSSQFCNPGPRIQEAAATLQLPSAECRFYQTEHLSTQLSRIFPSCRQSKQGPGVCFCVRLPHCHHYLAPEVTKSGIQKIAKRKNCDTPPHVRQPIPPAGASENIGKKQKIIALLERRDKSTINEKTVTLPLTPRQPMRPPAVRI